MSDEIKETKKTKKKTVETESNKVSDVVAKLEKLSVQELKFELQKYVLNIRSGIETNTGLIKKMKKMIARKLTLQSVNK